MEGAMSGAHLTEMDGEVPGTLVTWPHRGTAREWVVFWWTLTTDKAYLTSSFSRRAHWFLIWNVAHVVFCLLWVVFWTAGFVSGYAFLATLATAVALTLCVLLFPPETLRADFCMVSVVECWLASHMAFEPSVASMGQPVGYPILAMMVFTIFVLGVHSTAVVLFTMASIVLFFVVDHMQDGANYPIVLQSAFWGVFACALTTVFELLLAHCFYNMNDQLRITTRIVQHIYDGQFALDMDDGRIMSPSPGLTKLLGSSTRGRSLLDFVRPRDKAAIRGQFMDGKPNFGRPVLATFERAADADSNAKEFDGQLVAYTVEDGFLCMVVQVVGEVRDVQPLEEVVRETVREGPSPAERTFVDRVRQSAARARGAIDTASVAPTSRAVLKLDVRS